MKGRGNRRFDAGARCIGYVRVSTEEQAESGAGVAAQRLAIDAEVARREWELIGVGDDAGYSGKAMSNRPALSATLARLAAGDADVLVIAKLDRLSRSMLDFCTLLERAKREGWRIVILDLGIDLTTPSGEVLAHVAAAFAQFERRLIADRTRAALAARKAAGVRLGRPRRLPESVVNRVVRQRSGGETLATIANGLTNDRVPTAQGGARWYPSTVAAVMRSAALDVTASA